MLAIDDEAWIRKLLMQALKAKGYEVEIASDGPAAIEMFRSGLFDLVIVDLAMPMMSGNEVAAEIILADPVRYEGGLLMWAELFSERMKREAQHK